LQYTLLPGILCDVRAIEDSDQESPVNPALTDVMASLSDAGYWAIALDTRWRAVAQTAEMAAATGADYVSNSFRFGPEDFERMLQGATGSGEPENTRELVRHLGGWMLTDLAVDRQTLREMLHPALCDVADEIVEKDAASEAWTHASGYFGQKIGATTFALRVRDATGAIAGTVLIAKPGVGMNTIGLLTAAADVEHLQRMRQLSRLARRPTAVMFADLEGSTPLSKRMPTSAYFTLIRRWTRAADQCVIDGGGLVGRHAGDGVAAFFVAETSGSESTAARAAIETARAFQASMRQIAERHDLPEREVTVNAGLHWGATLHIGSIITVGRSEVTALGDAVNEAARIEACATGGRVLGSKDLIERLDLADAALLGIDPDRMSYTQLADLETATEKARRDAPAIPVCDVSVNSH
jgi:class 3 adenylate cyclase